MRAERSFTIRDLELCPDDGNRYEIIDGELYVSKQPHWHHQLSCSRVTFALEGWSEPTNAGVTLTAPGIIFALDQAVAPDLVRVGRERFDQIAGEDGKLHGAPDLVVEVLSPGETNAERDRALKLKLYSRRAVREYWILDWQQVTIDVYRRDNGALVLIATLRAEDTFTSPMLPGFAASVSHLRAPR
jgi:Uma2 family endonuclease